MNFEDVLTLIKAGYTKEEIGALTAGTGQKPAAADQKPAAAEQKPEGTGQKPAAEEQKPEGTEQKPAGTLFKPLGTEQLTETLGADLTAVLSKINDTLAALQAAAITGDSREGGATKLTAGQSLAKAITMTK